MHRAWNARLRHRRKTYPTLSEQIRTGRHDYHTVKLIGERHRAGSMLVGYEHGAGTGNDPGIRHQQVRGVDWNALTRYGAERNVKYLVKGLIAVVNSDGSFWK